MSTLVSHGDCHCSGILKVHQRQPRWQHDNGLYSFLGEIKQEVSLEGMFTMRAPWKYTFSPRKTQNSAAKPHSHPLCVTKLDFCASRVLVEAYFHSVIFIGLFLRGYCSTLIFYFSFNLAVMITRDCSRLCDLPSCLQVVGAHQSSWMNILNLHSNE